MLTTGIFRLRAFWQRSLINKLILLALPLLCCALLRAPSPGATPAATAPPTPTMTEPTSEPTPEPTTPPASPVAITVEGLTPLLLQAGDLPAGWTGATVFEESPVDYDGPAPIVVLNQGLREPGARVSSGNVVLWVFADTATAGAAFANRTALVQRVVDADAERQQPAIGEQSLLVVGHGDVFVVNQLVFVRCTAVVEIDLGLASEIDSIVHFARQLDARLQAGVCP